MDLGLQGKWAVVCGASKGLGFACAQALANEGVNLVINSRTAQTLDKAAQFLSDSTGVQVIPVAADIATPNGQEAVLAAAKQVDILITNAGGPPPGDFREFDRSHWIKAVEQNMITPIELIKAVVDGMIARKFGRIVNITSTSVKAPVDGLCLSNGARAGLTGFIAGVSREVASHNVTINNLLPGKFDTDRLRNNTAKKANLNGRTVDEELAYQAQNIPAGRIGVPAEFGHACAFLCSAHAGYITGQNLVIDGGAYRGVL
ncbi:MAG: SDR family oxidoreductase [Burkholderiaceae bacterium]|nr:SDR family oxidoreductase [Burkholderiaceae bacterium]MCD8536894.1 SDR family oxidoreductase [Burkholderiaceae bacterium]MCD8566079.1 SDR family oxidoreductase [Burkholderiaceae bacterium]